MSFSGSYSSRLALSADKKRRQSSHLQSQPTPHSSISLHPRSLPFASPSHPPSTSSSSSSFIASKAEASAAATMAPPPSASPSAASEAGVVSTARSARRQYAADRFIPSRSDGMIATYHLLHPAPTPTHSTHRMQSMQRHTPTTATPSTNMKRVSKSTTPTTTTTTTATTAVPSTPSLIAATPIQRRIGLSHSTNSSNTTASRSIPIGDGLHASGSGRVRHVAMEAERADMTSMELRLMRMTPAVDRRMGSGMMGKGSGNGTGSNKKMKTIREDRVEAGGQSTATATPAFASASPSVASLINIQQNNNNINGQTEKTSDIPIESIASNHAPSSSPSPSPSPASTAAYNAMLKAELLGLTTGTSTQPSIRPSPSTTSTATPTTRKAALTSNHTVAVVAAIALTSGRKKRSSLSAGVGLQVDVSLSHSMEESVWSASKAGYLAGSAVKREAERRAKWKEKEGERDSRKSEIPELIQPSIEVERMDRMLLTRAAHSHQQQQQQQPSTSVSVPSSPLSSSAAAVRAAVMQLNGGGGGSATSRLSARFGSSSVIGIGSATRDEIERKRKERRQREAQQQQLQQQQQPQPASTIVPVASSLPLPSSPSTASLSSSLSSLRLSDKENADPTRPSHFAVPASRLPTPIANRTASMAAVGGGGLGTVRRPRARQLFGNGEVMGMATPAGGKRSGSGMGTPSSFGGSMYSRGPNMNQSQVTTPARLMR